MNIKCEKKNSRNDTIASWDVGLKPSEIHIAVNLSVTYSGIHKRSHRTIISHHRAFLKGC